MQGKQNPPWGVLAEDRDVVLDHMEGEEPVKGEETVAGEEPPKGEI